MPISRKQDYLREIAQMVRKESFSFDPVDRVPLDRVGKGKDGRPEHYYLGDIYHDFDLGKLCFRIYGDDGKLLVPSNGPRLLENVLSSKELLRVSRQVGRYFQESLSRAKNISLVNGLLDELPDWMFRFQTDAAPTLSVDRNLDGRYVDVNLNALFRDPVSNLWVEAVVPGSGERFNYEFSQLSDNSVSAVVRGLENELGRSLDRSREQKTGDVQKVENRPSGQIKF